jgi:hypothetical protein
VRAEAVAQRESRNLPRFVRVGQKSMVNPS